MVLPTPSLDADTGARGTDVDVVGLQLLSGGGEDVFDEGVDDESHDGEEYQGAENQDELEDRVHGRQDLS